MSVQPVNAVNAITATTPQKTPQKKGFPIVPVTGYGALALGVASGIAGAKKKIKLHRYLAYAAGALALIHTGYIEYRHRMNKSHK